MARLRKLLGGLALAVIAIELLLVLTGAIDFGSAARLVVAMELCLGVFVVIEIVVVVKAVQGARAEGIDLPVALERSFAMFFPVVVARYVRQDLMLIRAISMLVTGRRDVAEGEHAIGYSGPLVVMLAALTVGDGLVAFALHLLLPPGVLRTVALVLGVIGLVWLTGFVASLICYPHVISRDRLRLRFSVFQDVVVPVAAIRSVSTTSRPPRTSKSAELLDDELVMAIAGQANMIVDLDAAAFTSLNPKISDAGALNRVTFYADQHAETRQRLAAIAQGRPYSAEA